MARRDSMADVMEALGIISQAASNIHATDVAGRMDTLRIEAEKAERLDERQWRKELTDESREWQLNTMLLQDSRSRSLDARSSYNDLVEDYSQTAGKLPDMTSNTKSILDSAYQGDMDNVQDMITFYDDQTVELEREGKRLSSQLYQTGIEAKKEYAERFPDYVSANVEDAIIDPIELDMLTSDLKREANENKMRAIADKIKVVEGGDRANRTNNPGAMIYAPWQEEYGAIKKEENAFWQYTGSDGKTKEVFSEDAIPEGVKSSKYYTSEFPDKASGEAALNELVSDIWTKSEGDPLRFTESYSGLQPGTEEFGSYAKAIESINLLDTSDLLASKITEDYYKIPIESRISAGASHRLAQAENEQQKANIGFALLQPYSADGAFLKKFGNKKHPGRVAIEVALGQGSTEAFYYFIQDNPDIATYIKSKLRDDNSVDGRKFKTFYNQVMKGMDKSINLRFPGQEISLKDQIGGEVDSAVSVDDAFRKFMTLTQGSGLSREQREDSYDDFLDSMTKKWGANVETEIDSIMNLMKDELSIQDSLNNIERLSTEKISDFGRLKSSGL